MAGWSDRARQHAGPVRRAPAAQAEVGRQRSRDRDGARRRLSPAMSRFRTLRGRLTAAAVLVATVLVAIVVLAFNLILSSSLDGDVNSRLRARAAAVGTTVYASHGQLRVHESPDDQAIDAEVWVFDGARPVLAPHAPTAVQQAAQQLARRGHGYRTLSHPEVRLYSLPVSRAGKRGVV